MKNIIDYIVTIILIMLGSIHTILTPIFYSALDVDSLWFAGTGLAFLFLGFINIFRIRTNEIFIKAFCLFSNSIVFVYCILIVLILTKPQALISLIDLFFLLVLSLVDVNSYLKRKPGRIRE